MASTHANKDINLEGSNFQLLAIPNNSNDDNNNRNDNNINNDGNDNKMPVSTKAKDRRLSWSESIRMSVKNKAHEVYKTIQYPKYFAFFNLLVVIQAVPAITYYVLFFGENFYVPKSSGMSAVWGATIGSFACTFVTTALVPAPPGVVTKPLCVAMIVWQFLIAVTTFISAICLGYMLDFHGMAWCILAFIASSLGGCFLLWYGLLIQEQIVRENAAKYQQVSVQLLDVVVDDVVLDIDNSVDNNLNTPATTTTPAATTPTTTTPATTATKPSSMNWIYFRFYAMQSLIWLTLLVFYVIPAGFGVNSAFLAWEYHTYTMPGQLYSIPATYQSNIKIDVHMHCIGPIISSKPSIVIEADFGTSGFAYYGLQLELASSDWRTCIYDRPGYGWSDIGPLGSDSPKNSANRLYDLLKEANEAQGNQTLILIGHGKGSELAQIYSHLYPNNIAGFGILDGYSYEYRLDGKSNNEIDVIAQSQCGNIHICRTMETIGLIRPYSDSLLKKEEDEGRGFEPTSEYYRYKATQTNGRYWAARYSDYCTTKDDPHIDPTRHTDYLTEHGTQILSVGNNKQVKWPQLLANIPVLVATAGKVIDKSDIKRQQANQYCKTISPTDTTTCVECVDCYHSYPIGTHISWTVDQINTAFAVYV